MRGTGIAGDQSVAARCRDREDGGEQAQSALADPVMDASARGRKRSEAFGDARSHRFFARAREEEDLAAHLDEAQRELLEGRGWPAAHVVLAREVQDPSRPIAREAHVELARSRLDLASRDGRIEARLHVGREMARERERALHAVHAAGRRGFFGQHRGRERLGPIRARHPQPPRRARGQGDHGALDVALCVDRKRGSKARKLLAQARPGGQAPAPLEQEDPGQPRHPREERGELRLHRPPDLGARVAAHKGVEYGQRKDHVSQVREAHQEDSRER